MTKSEVFMVEGALGLDKRIPAHVTVICSDYFDTIVSRAIHPEDVKRQWAERLSHAFSLGLGENELYTRRARLEAALCKENEAAGNDPEFNVLECYRSLWNGLAAAVRPSQEAFMALALELEISIECAVQRLDESVVRLLRDAASRGLRLVLISDFYMPEVAFRRMLQFHGIETLFERVFVSADTLLTKRSGRTYPNVIEALGITAGQALMIGDNAEADSRQPQRYNIAAMLLDRTERHAHYATLARRAADKRVTAREIEADLTADSASVFPELALTLYTFTERLYVRLLGSGIRDVFFMAREGQFLKLLFDRYQNRRAPTSDLQIRSHYLEVSRRSTFLPSLGPIETETFDILFRQYRRISAEEFLLNLGLEALLPELQRELSGRVLHERIDEFPGSDTFRDIMASRTFRAAYESARKAGRQAMLAYLDAFPRLAPEHTLSIVDVGWKGTIQDNIRRMLLSEESESGRLAADVNGFYLGLVSGGEAREGNSKLGLIFSGVARRTPHFTVFNENRALFEVMLAADHGSTAGYRLKADGTAEAVLSEFSEHALFRMKVQPEQVRLLAAFDRLDELLFHRYCSEAWLLDVTARHHARMVFEPTRAEIAWFTGVYHVENFGVFERSEFDHRVSGSLWMTRARFALALLRRRGQMDLGFWPWLSCRQRGGRMIARAYRMYRLR